MEQKQAYIEYKNTVLMSLVNSPEGEDHSEHMSDEAPASHSESS